MNQKTDIDYSNSDQDQLLYASYDMVKDEYNSDIHPQRNNLRHDQYIQKYKKSGCSCNKVNVIISLLVINIIFTSMLIIGGAWFVKPANDIITLFQNNKDRINTTFDQINRMLDDADIIMDVVMDFKTFVEEKVINALCKNYITRKVMGDYLCPNISINEKIDVKIDTNKVKAVHMETSKEILSTIKSITRIENNQVSDFDFISKRVNELETLIDILIDKHINELFHDESDIKDD